MTDLAMFNRLTLVRGICFLWLLSKEAIAPGAIFMLSDDSGQPGKKCLVAYQFSPGVAPASGVPQVYQGASGRLEPILMVGKEKADQLGRDLMR